MAEFPALPIWTDAYIADTGDLTAAEHGAYLVMMMLAWRRPDCALPNDMGWLKRSLGGFCSDMHGNRFNALVPGILKRFWELGSDGKWRQKRLTKERDYLSKRSEKQAERAKKRWSQSNEINGADDATARGGAYAPTPTPTPTPIEEREAKASPKKTRRSAIDPDWQPDEQDRAFAEQRGVSHVDQRDPFVNHHVAKGTLSANWNASWRTWVLNAVRFAAERGPSRGGKSGGLTGFASLLFDEAGGRGFGRVDEATVLDERGDPVGEVAPFPRRGAAAAR